MFRPPFGLYCSACFGSLFVSILYTCCSHFLWYCFISFTMFCAPVFPLIHWFFSLSSFVIPSKCLKTFICAASKHCSYLFFSTQTVYWTKKTFLNEQCVKGSQTFSTVLSQIQLSGQDPEAVFSFSIKKHSVILLLLRSLPLPVGLYSLLLFCVHSIRSNTALVRLGVFIIAVARSHSDPTFGKTPLDEWSALCRDLYLTTHNTHWRQTSRRDSNPHSKQAHGRRSTPYTAWPLGSAFQPTDQLSFLTFSTTWNVNRLIYDPFIATIKCSACQTPVFGYLSTSFHTSAWFALLWVS